MKPFRVSVLERDGVCCQTLIGVSDRRRWRRFARKMRQQTYRGYRIERHPVYGIPAIWVSDTFAARHLLVAA